MTVKTLIQEDKEACPRDYTLTAEFCWIEVGDVSIYIRRSSKKLSVELYRKGKEIEDSLASAIVDLHGSDSPTNDSKS